MSETRVDFGDTVVYKNYQKNVCLIRGQNVMESELY